MSYYCPFNTLFKSKGYKPEGFEPEFLEKQHFRDPVCVVSSRPISEPSPRLILGSIVSRQIFDYRIETLGATL